MKIFAIILITLLFCVKGNAQVLEASVSSDVTQMSSEFRDKLSQFSAQIQNYINNNQTQYITNSQKLEA